MIIETFLGITAITIAYNVYRTRKVQNRVHLLESQNSSLTEAMLLPSGSLKEDYILHSWNFVGAEVIDYSIFSMQPVRMAVEKCSKCGLIHRYIKEGYRLAKSKGILEVEGFYINGIRTADNGCHKVKFAKTID